MSQHISETQLDDYADGTLDDAARAQIDAHLAHCDECRARLTVVTALLNDLRALPHDIQPARDLRTGIAERLAAARPALPLQRNRAAWYRNAGLLAAAAALVVVTATVTHWWTLQQRTQPVAPTQASGAHASAIPVSFRNQEARYITQIASVQSALDRERDSLAPATVRILERNMAIIDQAIEESRAALDHDPANRDLGQMVLSAYQQKLELLRRARAFAL